MTQVFADPTYDLTFKMLFANPDNKDVLIDFLNCLLDLEGEIRIKDLEILPCQLTSESQEAVQAYVDVRCKTFEGEEIAIEMQRMREPNFLAKSQYDTSRLLAQQLRNHKKMQTIYLLIISKEDLFDSKDDVAEDNEYKYEKTARLKFDKTASEVPGIKAIYKYFELRKFKELLDSRMIGPALTRKQKWLQFLKECPLKVEIPQEESETMKKAYSQMKIANWKDQIRLQYEQIIENEYSFKQQREEEINRARVEREIRGEIKGNIQAEIRFIKKLIEYCTNNKEIEANILYLLKYQDSSTVLRVIRENKTMSEKEIYEIFMQMAAHDAGKKTL